jgi:hypothetical protein
MLVTLRRRCDAGTSRSAGGFIAPNCEHGLSTLVIGRQDGDLAVFYPEFSQAFAGCG